MYLIDIRRFGCQTKAGRALDLTVNKAALVTITRRFDQLKEVTINAMNIQR
jgi:hypothetical protein